MGFFYIDVGLMKLGEFKIPTLLMGSIAVALLLVGRFRSDGSDVAGLKYAFGLLLKIFPLLICAFVVAGMISALLSPESVARWIGRESGLKGIALSSIAGALTPGGPFICMPIAAGLVGSGAAVGPIVSYLTAWSLISLARLPIEVGILGWRLTLARMASTILLAPLAGALAQFLFGSVDIKIK